MIVLLIAMAAASAQPAVEAQDYAAVLEEDCKVPAASTQDMCIAYRAGKWKGALQGILGVAYDLRVNGHSDLAEAVEKAGLLAAKKAGRHFP